MNYRDRESLKIALILALVAAVALFLAFWLSGCAGGIDTAVAKSAIKPRNPLSIIDRPLAANISHSRCRNSDIVFPDIIAEQPALR